MMTTTTTTHRLVNKVLGVVFYIQMGISLVRSTHIHRRRWRLNIIGYFMALVHGVDVRQAIITRGAGSFLLRQGAVSPVVIDTSSSGVLADAVLSLSLGERACRKHPARFLFLFFSFPPLPPSSSIIIITNSPLPSLICAPDSKGPRTPA